MKAVVIASLVAAAPAPPAVGADIWRACTIETEDVCTTQGCARGQPRIWLYVATYQDHGKQSSIYYRCDRERISCDSYVPVVARSGSFVIFSLPRNGVVSKLGPDDRITDIATLMDTAFVSRGTCKLEPPPLLQVARRP